MATWQADPVAPDLRWTEPSGWHVTLAFLGPTDRARIPDLVTALAAAVQPIAPFRLAAGGVGAFPRPGAAQAVWYGFRDPDRELADLAARIQAALLPPGARHGFHAHLTLGRSRVRGGQPLTDWLATLEPPDGSLPVRAVSLFRSHLARGPAQYEALATVLLGGAGSAHG